MGAIAGVFGYLLNALYTTFNNYGIAIIIFSVVLRLILIPITIKQQKSMKKSAELQDEMKAISAKYKNNPEKLNQETIDLYKREKMSPFSGCLSSIVQIIIILSVFWLVSQPLTYMKKIDSGLIDKYKQEIQTENNGSNSAYSEIEVINKKGAEDENVYINMDFLGLDLSKVPSGNMNDWRVYVIPALYVISSVASIKLTTKLTEKNQKSKKEEEDTLIVEDPDTKEIVKTDDKKGDELDAMQNMSKNMTYMLPLMSVFIAFIAPLGLALYWFISNVLMIVEKIIIDKVMKHKEEKENV